MRTHAIFTPEALLTWCLEFMSWEQVQSCKHKSVRLQSYICYYKVFGRYSYSDIVIGTRQVSPNSSSVAIANTNNFGMNVTAAKLSSLPTA